MLSPSALAALERHAWPGNVRELKNVVERAVVLCRRDVIEASDLVGLTPPRQPPSSRSLVDEISDLEKQRIVTALDRANGNQSQAARDLGIPRRTLIRRLQEYGLMRRSR